MNKRERITSYENEETKTQAVIDYCARNCLVPRQADANELPGGWDAISRSEIRDGIETDLGISVSESMPGWTWERLGANSSVEAAIKFLEDHREYLIDRGLDSLYP